MKVEERRRLGLLSKRIESLERQHREVVEKSRHSVVEAKNRHQTERGLFRVQLERCRRAQGSCSPLGLSSAMAAAITQQEALVESAAVAADAGVKFQIAQRTMEELACRGEVVASRVEQLCTAISSVVEMTAEGEMESLASIDADTQLQTEPEPIEQALCVQDDPQSTMSFGDSPPERHPQHHEQSSDYHPYHQEADSPETAPMPASLTDWEAASTQGSGVEAGGAHTALQVAVPMGAGRKVSIAVLCDHLARIRVLLATQGEGLHCSAASLRAFLLGQQVNALEVLVTAGGKSKEGQV